MKIEPPADDLGLQHLKATDRTKGKLEQVGPLQRYARIAPSEERRDHPHEGVTVQGKSAPQGQLSPHDQQPRRGERRSRDDRRRSQAPALIDTRSPHERRTDLRRAEEQEEGHIPPHGIDELA
jgi:hypothetical protein